jgi:hypothetical protein
MLTENEKIRLNKILETEYTMEDIIVAGIFDIEARLNQTKEKRYEVK